MNQLINMLLRSKGWGSFIVCAVLFIVITLMNQANITVECVSKDQSCVVSSNFLGFKQTNNTLKPESIAKTIVKEYYERRYSVSSSGRKRRHNYKRYKLYVVDSSGNSSLLLDNISTKSKAEDLGADLLTCINAQNYPCKISK